MEWLTVLFTLIASLSSASARTLNFNKSPKGEIYFEGSSVDICENQFLHYQKQLKDKTFWAREMRDSWGNLPSGIFSGNVYDFGSFDQCINFKHESKEVGEILGQHCTLLIPFDFEDNSNARFMPPTRNPQINVGVGVCVPASCSPKQVKELADEFLTKELNVSTTSLYDQSVFCSVTRDPFEFNNLQIFATFVFASVLTLLVSSTVYEVICRMKNVKTMPILCAFSIYSNSKAIMTLKPSFSKEIVFLHGIRSLSMIWIVLCHTYMITFWLVPAINSHSLIDWLRNFPSMFLFSGFMGVDTFFMLSALLMTTSLFRELDRTKKINVPVLLVKRYARITVPFAAGVLLTVTFFYNLSNGPLWTLITKSTAIDLCEEFWWTSLLYVGNYVNPGKLCFGHSWYLMVDMQLYFLSPILLYPLWRLRKRISLVIIIIFAVASSSVIFVFVIFMLKGFCVSFLSELGAVKDSTVYTVTHGRIDSWMMGIFTGYVMYTIQGKVIKIRRVFVAFGWFLSISTILTLVFVQYPLQQENFKKNSWIFDATYDSLKRISWCLALSWVILACHLSYGGFVQKFLSLPIWLPISKLSFCIYLVHLPVQLVYLASIRAPQFFSNFHATYKFFGDFGVSFFVAFAWALMFEYPTLNIIAVLTSKRP